MEQWRRWLPAGVTVALALVLLGPALLPGYVISYDMVWVPDLALRSDFLGLGTGLPRAVPSDAVVAVLDEIVPGMLLQKLTLVGCLVVGGLGAHRLVSGPSTLARVAAVVAYVWNPFVVERLVIGHWPLLVTYAVLPWTIRSLIRWSAGDTRRAWWGLLALGGLSPSGGVMMAVVALVTGGGRLPFRRWLELVGVALVANAPWLVAGLLHLDLAQSDPRGAAAFALSDEGMLPGPMAALGLGGIWSAGTVPTSRTGPLAVVALAVTLGLAVMALRGVLRGRRIEGLSRMSVLWAVGYGSAVVTWLAPGASAWLIEMVPGGGLMRDGSRLLLLCAPLVAVLVAHGVAELVSTMSARWQRVVMAGCLAIAPVALMPDAGGGVAGRLSAVTYPTSYERARAAVGERGDVLVLPFTSYRTPTWNGHRPVLDPLGRYLQPNFLVNDELRVDGVPLSGEDRRVTAAARALAGDDPAVALAELGIRTVVVDRTVPGDIPVLDGREILGGDVQVFEIAGTTTREPPLGWLLMMGMAWAGYVAVLVGGVVLTVRRPFKQRGVQLRR